MVGSPLSAFGLPIALKYIIDSYKNNNQLKIRLMGRLGQLNY